MSFYIKAQAGRGTANLGGNITIQSQSGKTWEMDNDFIKQMTQVLKMLAQRKHPEITRWISDTNRNCYVCHICDQDVVSNLRSHAEMHLKEYNLLPFM